MTFAHQEIFLVYIHKPSHGNGCILNDLFKLIAISFICIKTYLFVLPLKKPFSSRIKLYVPSLGVTLGHEYLLKCINTIILYQFHWRAEISSVK